MRMANIVAVFIHDLDELLESGRIDRVQHQRVEMRLLALQKTLED